MDDEEVVHFIPQVKMRRRIIPPVDFSHQELVNPDVRLSRQQQHRAAILSPRSPEPIAMQTKALESRADQMTT